jgi:hypothetical protein
MEQERAWPSSSHLGLDHINGNGSELADLRAWRKERYRDSGVGIPCSNGAQSTVRWQ